jgi:hypothetical protein
MPMQGFSLLREGDAASPHDSDRQQARHAAGEFAFSITGHAASLDVHATRSRIAEVARQWASTLRDATDLARVDELLLRTEADGRGVTGSIDVINALGHGRVCELYFTLRLLEEHAADAESAVRKALATDAVVEQVSGPAAERLDQAGGIGARLRYAPAPASEVWSEEPAVASPG